MGTNRKSSEIGKTWMPKCKKNFMQKIIAVVYIRFLMWLNGFNSRDRLDSEEQTLNINL